jgi:hypothetical protein
LSNNSGAASNSIYACTSFPATTANVVERNFVHSSHHIYRDYVNWSVFFPWPDKAHKNNMVRLGVDAAGLPSRLDVITECSRSLVNNLCTTAFMSAALGRQRATPVCQQRYRRRPQLRR